MNSAEAAGVAGVALTALTTSIFKAYEKLQFTSPPSTTITFNIKYGVWSIILTAFFFHSFVLVFHDLLEDVEDGPFIDYTTNIDFWEQFNNCVPYFVAGFIILKVFKDISSGSVLLASTLSLIISLYYDKLAFIVWGSGKIPAKKLLAGYSFAPLWLLFALSGTYLARKFSNR